jgi:hypothetical protein
LNLEQLLTPAFLIPHPSALIPKEINRWLISLLLGGEQGPQDQSP